MSHPDPPRDAPVLSCNALVKRYENIVAVDKVSLSIQKGECFGLLGPNGAGKTTTVEMMEGLTAPDSGTIQVLGLEWTRQSSRLIRQRIGVQLQETQMADKLTVTEVLSLFRSFYDKGLSVDETLDIFELRAKAETRYHKLSGGQKQRLSLAAALVNEPDILFLDEPTTGLDPQARVKVWDMVGRFKAKGGTVVLTTHYMEEAQKLCDRLAIMDHGRVVVAGTPAELIGALDAAQIITVTLDGHIAPKLLADLPGVSSASGTNGTYALHVRSLVTTLPALLRTTQAQARLITGMSTHQASLDDVFLAHTGRALRDA